MISKYLPIANFIQPAYQVLALTAPINRQLSDSIAKHSKDLIRKAFDKFLFHREHLLVYS